MKAAVTLALALASFLANASSSEIWSCPTRLNTIDQALKAADDHLAAGRPPADAAVAAAFTAANNISRAGLDGALHVCDGHDTESLTLCRAQLDRLASVIKDQLMQLEQDQVPDIEAKSRAVTELISALDHLQTARGECKDLSL